MRLDLKGLIAGLALSTALSMGAGAVQAAENEIVIGAPISLTGPLAGDGKEQKWAYEQAVADVNAAGGLDIGGKKLPVRLVVGELDPKFTALAEEAAALLPRATVVRVPGVGHNVLLEAPAALCALLSAPAELLR